jgi:DNA helicase II / ATP-dependent DNA helicase PcrA
MEIVQEYSDHGRSGLNIAGREGLNQLVSDVESKRTDFSALLVYDVSRWGRFQDVDESAYYENVLKRAGTEIALFGNDVLKGTFRKQHYLGIECIAYPPYQPRAYALLVTETYKARARLVGSGKRNWSIAILVPTKKFAQSVSDTFREPPAGMTQIYHEASVDMEAAILAAHVIGFLMQPSTDGPHLSGFIDLMCDYFQGKGGDEIAKGDLDTSKKIRNGYTEYVSRQAVGKNIRANSILVNLLSVYKTARSKALIGDPDKDWISIGNVLREGACERLREIALEVRNVPLLERGTVLQTEISQDWRDNGCYKNALEIIRRAFLQEHFSSSSKPEIGIVIMNMHKAKGKQFDEVIIFEGWPIRAKNKEIVANPDRIVRSNLRSNIDEEARQNFRVAITRAKQKTLILMPEGDTCVIFRA